MSYPDTNNILTEIPYRKEIYSLRSDPDRNFRDPADGQPDTLMGKYLKIHSHQLFVRNIHNPNTPYRSLHLNHSTGTGKTLAAVAIAQEYIKIYSKIYSLASAKSVTRRNYSELDRTTPTIFVLGFGATKAAFIRELLKYPEFGFITVSEKEELVKKQRLADSGLPEYIRQYKEYFSFLKKRITNKSKNGFYKFYGYQEFVNRLFLSENIKLTDLETQVAQKIRAGESVTLEQVVYDNIANGKIQVNQSLLAQFENSLLICDEIHNTYNMNMKNNYGVAIQFVLDTVKSIRFLSLSATPINNNPSEAVELTNYLISPTRKITKQEFFANSRTLLPGKLEELGELTKGRISFLQDINIKYFPKRVFMGEYIKLPKTVEGFEIGTNVPYLKFIECPMSKLHQDTYSAYVELASSNDISVINAEAATKNNEDNLDDVEEVPEDQAIVIDTTRYSYHNIPTDGYSIYDMVLPNPDSEEFGLFRSGDAKGKINTAPQEWRDKNKIFIKKFSALNNVFMGDFLLRENIIKYSSKYANLLDVVMQIIKSSNGDPDKCQKIMIYHHRVKMSGVLLIQELLRANNILDEFSEPVEGTICCVCGDKMISHHKQTSSHVFKPVRFVVAHSDVDKINMDQSLVKFNSPDNHHGHNFMILVGSKIIKEGYDFKDIQNLIVASLPTNIPTLMQVFGRCIRKNSHIGLPPDQRRVQIYMLVSTINTEYKHTDTISPELYRYIDKLSDYISIQKIEREFNRNAVDADINRDIIMPQELYRQYFPNESTREPQSMLGNLYFEPAVKIPTLKAEELTNSTFIAYKYHEEEIRIITTLIKRIFMMNHVWTYDDLWKQVRSPPYGIEVNPQFFSEHNFIISLNNLVTNATEIISASSRKHEMSELALVERLFDPSDRYIYIDSNRYKIEQIDKYYILFPVISFEKDPVGMLVSNKSENVRDKERNLFKLSSEHNEKLMVDADSYIRRMKRRNGARINIDNFVKESKATINYKSRKNQFRDTFAGRPDIMSFVTEYSAEFQVAILEEAILNSILKTETDKLLTELYDKILCAYSKFGVVIYIEEVKKYKDTVKLFKQGLPSVSDKTPIGYISTKYIKLFDPTQSNVTNDETIREKGRWFEISKLSMNKHRQYKENNIIIGYLESGEDGMKFKLRKPVHLIKEDLNRDLETRRISKSEADNYSSRGVYSDTRLIERGIVCSTKNKYELLKIIASLGISVSKLSRGEIRIKNLCEIIKNKLIENEIKERSKDTRIKWLYGFWDELPSLTS